MYSSCLVRNLAMGRALFCVSICATIMPAYLGAEFFPSFQDVYQRSLQDMCWTGIY